MPTKKTFKALMDSIESVTQKLEHEQVDLEASLQLFKEGQALIKEAKTRLQRLEHEFSIIAVHDDKPAEE